MQWRLNGTLNTHLMKPNYQILLSGKDPTPLFEKWRGGQAALWGYTVSHRILELRVLGQDSSKYLCVYCGDVQHIAGPAKWRLTRLEFERVGSEEVILRDADAGFEVRAGVVGAGELPLPWKQPSAEEAEGL